MGCTGNMQVLGFRLGSFIDGGGVHREYVGFRVLAGFLWGGGLIGNIQALGLGAEMFANAESDRHVASKLIVLRVVYSIYGSYK